MKRIVEVTRKQEVKEQIEVEFPLFLYSGETFDGGGGYDTWTLVRSDLVALRITKTYNGVWEVKQEGRWSSFEPDGVYLEKSSAKDFQAALDELQTFIDAIRATSLESAAT